MDERLREYIKERHLPARSFLSFLKAVSDIVSSAFEVSGAAARVGGPYRELALRSTQDAVGLLERAERQGKGAPFVFFACIQDAVSAVKMFAAVADQSPDDGWKAANLAAFSGISHCKSAAEKEANEKFQSLFDATVSRVVAVMREAVRQLEMGGDSGRSGRHALKELEGVQNLIKQAGSGRMDLKDGLRLVDDLEAAGRRAAAAIGAKF